MQRLAIRVHGLGLINCSRLRFQEGLPCTLRFRPPPHSAAPALSPRRLIMTASPPAKKARNTSPGMLNKDPNGNRDMMVSVAQAHTNGIRPHASALDVKAQAKRIKMKVRERAAYLAKTGEEPIFYDVCDLLGAEQVEALLARGPEAAFAEKFPRGQLETVLIKRLSAHGDGLAIASSGDWIIAVPNALPGETALVLIYANERLYSRADLVRIIEHAAESSVAASDHTGEHTLDVRRREDLVGCKYFGQCSGCQYQNIEYSTQLTLKRNVIERAFRHYTGLPSSSLPTVKPTLASPLQYKYRTKLTPHFDLPHELRRGRRGKGNEQRRQDDVGADAPLPDVAIGFAKLGEKNVLDIEECSIATRAINEAMPEERRRIKSSIRQFKNGSTLLLRDSLGTFDPPAEDQSVLGNDQLPTPDSVTITDHHATVKESVGPTKFLSPAGAFFQNNRSILPDLLRYVQEQIQTYFKSTEGTRERFLVDAYCGSGLFSLCLAHLFTKVAGIEISKDSIQCAKENARLNGATNVDFVAGDAMEIFKRISFPPAQTTVIIDPPRRGCDEVFIRQLLALGPHLIVYVSCNVHTQARDVGQIVRGRTERDESDATKASSPRYEVLSIRGADLFPQTYHVEGVCVLRRIGEGGHTFIESI